MCGIGRDLQAVAARYAAVAANGLGERYAAQAEGEAAPKIKELMGVYRMDETSVNGRPSYLLDVTASQEERGVHVDAPPRMWASGSGHAWLIGPEEELGRCRANLFIKGGALLPERTEGDWQSWSAP